MPLPTGHHAQETKELQALYDRLAERAMVELIKKSDDSDTTEGIDEIAWLSYKIATAMLNERNKK